MKKGFTLIELLVVVLIIGILSSIALPQYSRAVERARATEAVTQLTALTQAEDRYYLANGQYTNSLTDLDIDLPDPVKFWRYLSGGNGCFIRITSVKYDYYIFAYRDGGSNQWERYCNYRTNLGKGVCEGLRGLGYTIGEDSSF